MCEIDGYFLFFLPVHIMWRKWVSFCSELKKSVVKSIGQTREQPRRWYLTPWRVPNNWKRKRKRMKIDRSPACKSSHSTLLKILSQHINGDITKTAFKKFSKNVLHWSRLFIVFRIDWLHTSIIDFILHDLLNSFVLQVTYFLLWPPWWSRAHNLTPTFKKLPTPALHHRCGRNLIRPTYISIKECLSVINSLTWLVSNCILLLGISLLKKLCNPSFANSALNKTRSQDGFLDTDI